MISAQLRLWSVKEYHRMLKAGILTSVDRVELLDGQIIQMSPQLPPHAGTVQRIDKYFKQLLSNQADVRVQLPITLSTSEPEPDIAVVQISSNDYGDRHPGTENIFLMIEVADRTLNFDCEQKAAIYAKAEIADYWVINVNQRQVHVFRQPDGGMYQSKMIVSANSSLAPLAFPTLEIPLNLLFLPQ
ncbi:MAG: Uma2 family endonuclease [Cyanobacteria bacterium RM1_2_2]|nr:Uma2 family endonuclease [Cyanobacteria bacterium RM1_2_2]